MMEWFSRRIRAAVLEKLRGIQGGELRIQDPLGEVTVGQSSVGAPHATIQIHSLSFYRRIAWEGANGAGEAYLDGVWETDDLAAVMEIFARNGRLASGLGGRWTGRMIDFGRRLMRRNTLSGSKRNIAAHYDLSNDFFSLFLDPTMSYSAGVFDENAGGTMEGASLSKFGRVCRSLELKESDHLLEIGGGWGGLAIYAAREYRCRVTTTTISQEQYRYMKEAVAAAGLESQVTVLCHDYRKLTGEFDKIVSIEMIEAVGHQYFPAFFRQCQSLLSDDGLMLLQAILIPDQRYARYRKSQDFIQRHIFPGGCLPSLGALCEAAAAETEMKLIQMEDWADHYAHTLKLWREQFCQKLREVRALGMDDRFIRAWDYYFCYCEGGFRERQLLLTQLLFAGPAWRGNRVVLGENSNTTGVSEAASTDAKPETAASPQSSLEGVWA